LARERLVKSAVPSGIEPLEVIEKQYTIFALEKVSYLTKLVGAFVVGTAAFIVPVGSIEYENRLISIEQQVPYGDLLQNWVADIMYDVVAHSWYEVFDNIS
jgi:branched-chain amino acid aminotransferase